MLKAREITAFLHGSRATVLAVAVAATSCAIAWYHGAVVRVEGELGPVFESANQWIGNAAVSATANVALTAIVAFAMLYSNRIFNVLRSLTALVATMFLAIMSAMPSALGQLYGGTLLALLMVGCMMLLFSVYADRRGQRQVYLIFLLTTAAGTTQPGYLFYLPALLLGTMQMSIFSLRTLVAALLGIVTPAWLLFGFGIVGVADVHWPEMAFSLEHLFDSDDMVPTLVAIGFTMLLGIGFTVANLMKILSYNARVRSLNGFMTLLMVYTAVLMVVNFGNVMFYLPLFNCLVAYQIGHFFTYRRKPRSYIAILAVMACYAALYVWAVAAA